MKIVVVTPAYITNELHLDFTQQTVKSIKGFETEHDIDIVIPVTYCNLNYFDDVNSLSTHVFSTPENGVSIGWNAGINYARQQLNPDYILVCNNDIVFHPQAIDNLVKFAEEHDEAIMWTANEYPDLRTLKSAEIGTSFDEHPHFSCFMIKPEFVETMGKKEAKEPFPGLFDENFKPAYFEDGDMHNRILRNGFKALKTASALFYHYGSRTIKSDDDLNRKNASTYEKNREYFQSKWGWDPHGRAVEADDPIRFEYKDPFTP